MSDNQELGYFDPEEAVPKKQVYLRGGADEDEQTNENAETEGENEDFDEENVDETQAPNILLGKAKDEEKEEKEKRKKRRRAAAAMAGVLTALVILAVLLFLFVPKSPTASDRAIFNNQTGSPTSEPTSSPSEEQRTFVPTLSPVAGPATVSPTFSTDKPLSAKSCEELLVSPELHEYPQGIPFKDNYTMPDGSYLCADTYVGFPRRTDRNPWTAKLGQTDCEVYDFQNGTNICEGVGARRCTADELQYGAGQGTGCNGDNELIYSSTPCVTNGVSGIYQVNIELRDKNEPIFFLCETDLTTTTTVRCCADHEVDYQ